LTNESKKNGNASSLQGIVTSIEALQGQLSAVKPLEGQKTVALVTDLKQEALTISRSL